MSVPRPRRVLVLLHARDREATARPLLAWRLAECWRADGVEVVLQHGPQEAREAEVALNHVDLTITPSDYAACLLRHALALDAAVLDTSKRRLRKDLLGREDSWAGPVIVASDLDAGGEPEQRLLGQGMGACRAALWGRLPGGRWREGRPLPARERSVLPGLHAVPRAVWARRGLVVQRFVPEREGAHYALRTHAVLGPRMLTRRVLGTHPVVQAAEQGWGEEVAAHPDVLAFTRALRLDHGEVDYVEHEGRAVVLDVSRTFPAASGLPPDRQREVAARLAPGLYDLWAAHLARQGVVPGVAR